MVLLDENLGASILVSRERASCFLAWAAGKQASASPF